MGDSDFHDRFVTLQAGLIVPAPAYLLSLHLADRGFTLTRDGNTLVVAPSDRLTDADCVAIRRWKHHLLMLMAYHASDAHLRDDTVPTPRTGPIYLRRAS